MTRNYVNDIQEIFVFIKVQEGTQICRILFPRINICYGLWIPRSSNFPDLAEFFGAGVVVF
jgi:hypothetical protein